MGSASGANDTEICDAVNSAEWLIKQAEQLPDDSLNSVINALTLELLDRALQRNAAKTTAETNNERRDQ